MAPAPAKALEDYARHREDGKVSAQPTKVMRARHTTEDAQWKQVQVGQILKVSDGESFPADMVLLQSTLPAGKCYVETAELDGETNLKIRAAANDMVNLTEAGEGFDPTVIGGIVQCDAPNNELYAFNGTYTHTPGVAPIPLSNDCILLRGARLRNTEAVYGVVVYTGEETKLSMNMTAGPKKRSNVERMVR